MNNLFTFFTPTYNREKLIGRVFDSLMAQTLKNFEWIVLDDGSTDNTEKVIKEYQEVADFPIKYVKTENRGKVSAVNHGLCLAAGEWFIVFDSDDWCDKNTSTVLTNEVSELMNRDDYEQYCSISVLKRYKSGDIVGDDYSLLSKYNQDYITRSVLGISGDKWEIIKLSCHKKYKYRLVGNDKYQAPSYAWLMMASKFKTVFVNESLSVIEYQPDGISVNNIYHRVNSVESTIKYYNDISEIYKSRSAHALVRKCDINIKRFNFHKNGFKKGIYFNKHNFIALILYLNDRFKLIRMS